MVEGPYLAHFHVVGAAQDSAFLEALRTTLRRLSSSPGFGGAAVARHVYVELSRPAVSLHEEAGLSWRVCRISATCRVESGGRVAHLGSISTARSHVDARVACAEAASALAEAVVDKFVGYVGEARP